MSCYYSVLGTQLYKQRVSLSKSPWCHAWMVLRACLCPCTPLDLPMASDCGVWIPCWLPHGPCCNPGCLKITWNTRGLKICDSPREMLSRDHAPTAQGYPKATVCAKGRKKKGNLGKTLILKGIHQATEKLMHRFSVWGLPATKISGR